MLKKFFEKLTKSNNPNSKRYRWDMAKKIIGHRIRYVTEKIDDVDTVIGKEGSMAIKDDDLLVFASGDVVFRCPVVELSAWELLSKDGVVLTGPDKEHGNAVRTIMVFYVYYR